MREFLKNKFKKEDILSMLIVFVSYYIIKILILFDFSLEVIFNKFTPSVILGIILGHIFYEKIEIYYNRLKEFVVSFYYRNKHRIIDFYSMVFRFFKNVYIYRKELSNDYAYSVNLGFLQKSIERTCHYIENYGHEEDVSRMKKVSAMKRAIYILNVYNNDSFLEEAEKMLGIKYQYENNFMDYLEKMENGNYLYKGHTNKEVDKQNSELIECSHKLENEYWDELMRIIKGIHILNPNDWDIKYDGSDLRRWWD